MDWLDSRMRSFGNLCAEAVLEGDYDHARHWAGRWAEQEAARKRCNARYEDTKDDKAVAALGWDAARTYGRVTP
jgi:hypothetical protein